jgi:hypothetical protein
MIKGIGNAKPEKEPSKKARNRMIDWIVKLHVDGYIDIETCDKLITGVKEHPKEYTKERISEKYLSGNYNCYRAENDS